MNRLFSIVVILTLIMITLSGCFVLPVTTITVTPETPQNNSTIETLTPNFSWNASTPANTYSLQVATDLNFQGMVIEETGINQPNFSTRGDVLTHNQTYYWRVNAAIDGQTSDWSMVWSFRTTAKAESASITVNATLDGAPWSGALVFSISGANLYSNNSIPSSFENASPGSYTITYNSGGPPDASLSNISPAAIQSMSIGDSIAFTLNFHRQSAGVINVNATVDGTPWSGALDFTVQGPMTDSHDSTPASFSNMPPGDYTLTYNYGGPGGAALSGITPSPTQNLQTSTSITFTLNFNTQSSSSIVVNATVDGRPWSGKTNFTLRGPFSDSHSSVPYQFSNLPVGNYTLTYNFGGPENAVLYGITPAPSQNLSTGSTLTFTMNFSSQSSSTINVQAALDGIPWSGALNFTISGPFTDSGTSVPASSQGIPPGNYTITYNYGGPNGAVLAGISPSPYQTLPAQGTITFTLNFSQRQSTGTIMVNATLDGRPWEVNLGSGSIRYTLAGPKTDASNVVPDSFPSMPAGNYSLSYNSGGPIGGQLVNISPGPSQALKPGDSISFTMNFASRPRGSVTVNALLNGDEWSGPVEYVLNGSYVESGTNVPHVHGNAPDGMYSLEYHSGGPPEARFESITPSPEQRLNAGGNIVFTLTFSFIPGPEPENGLLK